MKKQMKQLLVAGTLLFFLGSCEKCSECHYDLAGAEVGIGEYCDDDLENIENSGITVDGVEYEVHCHDH